MISSYSLRVIRLYINIYKLLQTNYCLNILFIPNFEFSNSVDHNYSYSYFSREFEYSFKAEYINFHMNGVLADNAALSM